MVRDTSLFVLYCKWSTWSLFSCNAEVGSLSSNGQCEWQFFVSSVIDRCDQFEVALIGGIPFYSFIHLFCVLETMQNLYIEGAHGLRLETTASVFRMLWTVPQIVFMSLLDPSLTSIPPVRVRQIDWTSTPAFSSLVLLLISWWSSAKDLSVSAWWERPLVVISPSFFTLALLYFWLFFTLLCPGVYQLAEFFLLRLWPQTKDYASDFFFSSYSAVFKNQFRWCLIRSKGSSTSTMPFLTYLEIFAGRWKQSLCFVRTPRTSWVIFLPSSLSFGSGLSPSVRRLSFPPDWQVLQYFFSTRKCYTVRSLAYFHVAPFSDLQLDGTSPFWLPELLPSVVPIFSHC